MKHIFIANRGEIARRIATTAKKMGIQTSCLSDQNPPPKYLQDVVTWIHPIEQETPSVYLDGAKMLALAKEFGCDAVHPGFGFLSENSDFAFLIEKEGLTWIGPTADAIQKMASKSQARILALECGVPCTEALSHIDWNHPDTWKKISDFANKSTYPLLVKASFGGGGKGMRLVWEEKDLKEACERAYSEALSSFGNGSLVLERYIEKARHVEVQVFGDSQGNIHILGDRDCSIQRRHQKIIEEAPAFFDDESLRQKIHKSAKALAEKVKYRSAGTVEFLVTEKEFFFLEMNTRLQVEHPVTEEVFGLDLVEWQIRVAQGEELPDWSNLKPKGWAIEARLYGENPEQDFFPAPGFVGAFIPYERSSKIRWEIGLDSYGQISPFFDPMFAKIIGKGDDRLSAQKTLIEGLEKTFFVGGPNNLSYIRGILKSSWFTDKKIHTHFISEYHEQILQTPWEKNVSWHLLPIYLPSEIKPKIPNGYEKIEKKLQKKLFWKVISIFSTPHGKQRVYQAMDDGKEVLCLAYDHFFQKRVFLVIDHEVYESFLTTTMGMKDFNEEFSADQQSHLTAPVPGKVVKILKESGDCISLQETIFILESMKMEFQIKAQKSGKMDEVLVNISDQVTAGQVLGKIL